jgi:6-phosphogluconolactonase
VQCAVWSTGRVPVPFSRATDIVRPMAAIRRLNLVGSVLACSAILAAACVGTSPRRAAPASGAEGKTSSDAPAAEGATGATLVYVGLASGEIVAFHLDAASGVLGRRGTVAVGRSPASLIHSAEREALIAVDETTGLAVSLAINAKTGALTPVGRVATGAPASGATVDGSGKYFLAAHPGNGDVTVVAIKPDAGLSVIDTFRAGAGARAVVVHPAHHVALVANFRAGTVSQYTFNTGTGVLTPKAGPPLALPAGSGPTRFACHPSGRWVYLLDETSDAISVHVFDEDVKALSSLSSQIVSTLPEGFARAKSRPSDLALGPAGHFLYATNRGADNIATFAVEAGGTLKLVGHEASGGRAAGALAVDPSGEALLVANEGSKSLAVFHLDPTTGAPGGRHTVSFAAAPLAILIMRL